MTKQFPYFLCRIGGESFEQLARLEVSTTMRQHIDEVFQRISTQDKQRNKLCDSLHESIAAETDPRQQNQLLNLKRSLFNKRPIREKDIEVVIDSVSSDLAKQLKVFYTEQEDIKTLIKEDGDLFASEMINSRNELKQVAQEEKLQKGLLLSSQLLLNSIPSYIERDSAALRKKELKTEESLVKYLTRMCAKTSPFSTFTNLAMGKVEDQRPENILGTVAKTINSHICLNNYLYGFFKSVLIHLPQVYRQFRLRLNPTIRVENENYVFLTNSNNIEAFQRIGDNPVVELFHELIKDHQEGIVFGELINEIITNEYFDAEAEEIEAYITQLVSYGFIEFHLGVSGIDPFWDKTLISVLEPLTGEAPVLGELIEALKQVRKLASQYELAGISERRSLLNQAHSELRSVAMKLHELADLPAEERLSPEERTRIAAEKKAAEGEKPKEEEKKEETPEEETFTHQSSTYFHFKPEQIFYEDTSANISPSLGKEESAGIIEPLDKLLQGLQDFDGLLDEWERMQLYFENKYGKAGQVDVMRFYEDYYREIKRPEADASAKLKEEKEKDPKAEMKPILEVPVTDARQKANKLRLEKIVTSIGESIHQQAEELKIGLNQIGEDSTAIQDDYLRSYGAFLQPYRENGQLMTVVNAGFPGYGKMFSRFLHLLPKELTTAIKAWNKPQEEREIFIENCDASFFNANLHPPLMPFEVWMPGGQNTLPASEQIPVTSLAIVFDESNNRLVLKHSETGKEAYVFDLGFQGQRGRSPLFQLLSRFSLAKALFWQHISQSVNVQYRPKEGSDPNLPTFQPRIIFEEKLVIQRKSWWFKKALIPQLEPTDSEWDFFLKLNLWRKQFDLPDEVFVFITNHTEQQSLKPEELTKLGRDSYKPQYLNFNSPILVCNLFEKMLVKAPVGVRFEEMLPNSSQMESINGSRYVTEFVMQWYNQSPIAEA